MLQVEKARHVLLLREKLAEQNKSLELSKLDKEASNLYAKAKGQRAREDEMTVDEEKDEMKKEDSELSSSCEGDKEKELITKCLKLILQGRLPLNPPPVKVSSEVIKLLFLNKVVNKLHSECRMGAQEAVMVKLVLDSDFQEETTAAFKDQFNINISEKKNPLALWLEEMETHECLK